VTPFSIPNGDDKK